MCAAFFQAAGFPEVVATMAATSASQEERRLRPPRRKKGLLQGAGFRLLISYKFRFSHPLRLAAACDVQPFRQAEVPVELARDLRVLRLGRTGKNACCFFPKEHMISYVDGETKHVVSTGYR